MNDEATRWIFGILITALGAGFLILLAKSDNLKDGVGRLENRLVKLETLFELLGDKAARALHSPHTPELDKFLEMMYKGEKMEDAQVDRLLAICKEIEEDIGLPKEERSLAGTVELLTRMRYGRELAAPKKHDFDTQTFTKSVT